MKVAIILEQFDIGRGGAERSAAEMATCLSQLGHDVTVVAGSVVADLAEELPFGLHSLDVNAGRSSRSWRRFEAAVANHIADNAYDMTHSITPLSCVDVYQPRGGSILNGLRRHAASHSSRLVRWVKQSTAFFNTGRRIRIAAERKLCDLADGPMVAALSSYVAYQFRSDYGLVDDRLRIVRNGVMTYRFMNESARQEGARLRQLYDRDNELALFVFIAQNYKLKGLAQLIKAASVAMEQRNDNQRDFRVIIFGNEPIGSYWRLANRLALTNKVLFMGTTEKVPAVLNMADAVILPSYNDACSRVVLEGLAAGKPAITTRQNGACDFLGNGRYGIVVNDAEDINALAAALLDICQRERHKQFVKAIETDGLAEQVDMARHARGLVKLYECIMARK